MLHGKMVYLQQLVYSALLTSSSKLDTPLAVFEIVLTFQPHPLFLLK